MKAVFFEEFGGPEVLRVATLPAPDLEDGHLLIDVHCAGVNPIDWKARSGAYTKIFGHQFPIVAGFDYSGTVQAVGRGVSGFAAGDRVNGMNLGSTMRHGTYAEVTLVPAEAACHIPDDLSFEAAAAIPTGALTADQSLIDFGGLAAGQSVLIQAGAGGVGSLAIQLAKQRGATVLTTARAGDLDYVLNLGADYVVDFESQDFVQIAREHFPQGLDLVVDMIGGETLARGYETLRKGGRMALLVSQPDPSVDEKFGIHSEFVFTVSNVKRLSELTAMLVRGAIKLPEIKSMAIEDAAKAQIESEAGNVRGKLILKVQ
ncbi:MAG: NADP-dependent oxidoreductase [Alphaproteobacteria bacterium]|nr:NADP-dependent oxidoreductase [Alphaproteobacteria bacterium]